MIFYDFSFLINLDIHNMLFLKFIHPIFLPGNNFDAMLLIKFNFSRNEEYFRKKIFFFKNFAKT